MNFFKSSNGVLLELYPSVIPFPAIPTCQIHINCASLVPSAGLPTAPAGSLNAVN